MIVKTDFKAPFVWILVFLIVGVYTLPSQALTLSETKTNLRQMLQHPALSHPNTGIQITSLKTGQIIFQSNQNTPLIPASNMKLVTSAAALALLKPEFSFKTTLYTRGNIQGGTLHGNLYLKGFGDPDLTDERLDDLVQQLKYKGVQNIEGNLVLDDTFFDAQRLGKGWKDSYGAAAYSARTSALSLNHNTVKVWIHPGSLGKSAVIELDPPNHFFDINNNTITNKGKNRLKIVRYLNENGRNQIKITGNINIQSQPEVETINLDNPTLYTGAVFKQLLVRRGITLKGMVEENATPGKGIYEIGTTFSRPLAAIITSLNKHSINMLAEHLLKFLGATFENPPGSAEKGEKVITRFLEKEVGISSGSLVMMDGSGLSPLNRITPEALNKLLTYMYKRFDLSVDYLSSLAVSGVDGTLRKRMNSSETKRKIRAKTGFINGVSALSGYIYTDSQDILVFSILMNQFRNYSVARSIQDQICAELVHLSEQKVVAH